MNGSIPKSSDPFLFSGDTEKAIQVILNRYPKDRSQSALLPVLDLAQRQNGGWLSQEALQAVAERLALPPMRVIEVASFYSMFYLKPVGTYVIQVCRTTSCWLRGSDDLRNVCKNTLDLEPGESSGDGLFTFLEVECLGGCANAPLVQINDTTYEDVDAQSFETIIAALQKQQMPPGGSCQGRIASKSCIAPSLPTPEDV